MIDFNFCMISAVLYKRENKENRIPFYFTVTTDTKIYSYFTAGKQFILPLKL